MNERLEQYLLTLGVDLNGLLPNLHGWDVSIAKRNGEDVGMVIVKGPEIHILPFCERKAMTRRNIIEYLQPLIEKFGYATTRVPIAEEDHRLRIKLGFEFGWEDEQFTYWHLTKLPYQKVTS